MTDGVNIGNYKGVMLCNRPFNGVSVSKNSVNAAHSGNQSSFLTGIPPTSIGQNVPIYHEPPHAIKRDKKNTALSKHKKWLHDLQKERDRLEEALFQDESKKIEMRRKFSEREARVRAAICNPEDGPETENKIVKKKGESKNCKPMWALTEEKAENEVERKEEEEVDDLLEFANNLDIDEFMDEVEIKARVEQLKDQMSEVQTIVNEEEKEERMMEIRESLAAEGKNKALNANDLAKLSKGFSKDEDDDACSIATTVLSECKSIRSVHSSKSVAALTKRAQEKLGSLDTIQERKAINPVVPPKIIVHDEEEGARISKKNDPSNLPYMHRNPAI